MESPGPHVYDGESVNTLLVTANVGSLFEDPQRLLRPWLAAFLQKVAEISPKFLALHLQEVGGKTYEKSMEYVQEFIKRLCEAPEMHEFEFIRVYMDEDFKSAEHFTALGNLYFIHNDVKNVRIWNFLTHSWENAEGKNFYSGNIETIATKEKSKFPQHFFPECKWSRKGFMRTRWEIQKTIFDLVNIHLFHDASNLAACEEFPSVYCRTRRRALVHTLERFHLDEKNGFAPFFLFGDYNFRCDTEGVIKELTANLTAHRVQSMKNDSTKVHYRNSVGDNILTVGKKEFNHADHQLKFKEAWLKKFDRELEPLRDFLNEFLIEFPPSYPYEEDPEMPTDFMSTRCPSWCDRVLMSHKAMNIINTTAPPAIYNLIGENVCMGDHKPVYLNVAIKANQGTYSCCNNHDPDANNMATIHNIPDVTTEMPQPCPNKQFREHLLRCKTSVLNESSDMYSKKGLNTFDNVDNGWISNDEHLRDSSWQNNTNIAKWPHVSINVIDSDNIHVCLCSEISKLNNQTDVDSICPTCQNIIKKQPAEPRYRLVSKRLVLSKNIIVNRIDTQHLSTYFDSEQNCQDPYTPESAESHSPCPELNSSISTSSNSRISCSDGREFLDTEGPVSSESPRKNSDIKCYGHTNDVLSVGEGKQQRGVVSPGQLKSRLEDLRKKNSEQNFQFLTKGDGGDTGVGDVKDVDVICLSNNLQSHRHSNSCLPKCCNIH